MINGVFWKKIAENWFLKTDGTDIPDIGPIPDIPTEDEIPYEDITDEEIEDILADLGLDDL